MRKALDGGYLRNLEEKRGRPHRLKPGDPLPDEQVILPAPEELHGCTVAEGTPPGPAASVVDVEDNGHSDDIEIAPLATPEEEAEVERITTKFEAAAA